MRMFGKLKLSHQLLFILLIIPSVLIISLLYYSAVQHVTIQNKPLEQMALSTSATVSEKIDRNLYERFGDVQAFAYNTLAIEALKKGKEDSSLLNFMNTMTSYYVLYDLTMLCDISGKVIAVNSKDKNKKNIASAFLIGKSMNEQDWFRSSIVVGGPRGGAYYSDFNEDEDIAFIYGTKGYGMDFSAPVRNEQGDIIGVWRNRASWKEITQQIRTEAEKSLQKEVKGALILLMDKQGHLIDADKENNISKVTIGKNNLFKKFDFDYAGIDINDQDYLYGWAESRGAYTYKGNKWKFLTLIPKVKITDFNIYINSDWTGLMLFSFGLLLVGVIISLFFVKGFSKRMNKIKLSVQKLSKGEPELIQNITYKDEIGEMASAINTLNVNFKDIIEFSNEIGQGNLSVSYKPLGENDALGSSLLKMQTNLKEFNTEKDKQKWTSDKLALLGELFREQDEANSKYQKIISFLAKSVDAHQAALFVVNHQEELPVIELKAGYALALKRLKKAPLLWGESTIGQCIKDKEFFRFNNLPEEYTDEITSGLGKTVPNEIIILPVLFNDKAEGALEFSTLKTFELHIIQFLEKAADYIGSYIAQISITKQTEKMLQDTSILNEEMRNQQEEMRQNLEELNATQEEMRRQETSRNEETERMKNQYEGRIKELEEKLSKVY
jgi:methyl-accepting chemotaxis protein